MQDINAKGAAGDARVATAEVGKAVLEYAAGCVAELVGRWGVSTFGSRLVAT
jgi:creatinine amidohydrolase/Fe(II)-dependent formamide hydrolase-like protein